MLLFLAQFLLLPEPGELISEFMWLEAGFAEGKAARTARAICTLLPFAHPQHLKPGLIPAFAFFPGLSITSQPFLTLKLP